MKSRKEILLVGDKVLIRPDDSQGRTEAGLYLPDTVKEKEKARGGFVVKAGPGYAVPDPAATGEPWVAERPPRYIALEAKDGDYAIFLQSDAVTIDYEGKKYLIVPHRSILALIRTSVVND